MNIYLVSLVKYLIPQFFSNMNTEIKKYYNELATEYDDDRFANTYGQFIDNQEKKIVKRLVGTIPKENILDMACGTGRFLEFAKNGVDISPEMIKVSQQKYPDRNLFVESASDTHFEDESFDLILSFHLIMHLDKAMTKKVLDEAHRILKKGGKLIFDIPSEKRRKKINYKADNWHGANDFSMQEIVEMTSDKWKMIDYSGIMFLPIHRFPKPMRGPLLGLDTALCHSFLKEYSSYLVFFMEKK